MKLKIFLSFLFAISLCIKSIGQEKIDKYCAVIISFRGFSAKVKATVYFGESDSLFAFKNSDVITRLKAVNKLRSSVDVLNYMSRLGWAAITISPVKYTDGDAERLYFKKTFDSSEILVNGE